MVKSISKANASISEYTNSILGSLKDYRKPPTSANNPITFSPEYLAARDKERLAKQKAMQEPEPERWPEPPEDPHSFYEEMGYLDHPETREPILRLADYQYSVWQAMQENKYVFVCKSQKIGMTTSVLLADFQMAILPASNPLSCRGRDIIVIAQSLDIARQHLYTLRRLIASSKKYRGYMITKAPPWMARDETTKVNKIYIHNPDNPTQPTRIIGLGPSEAGIWSWERVKHVHMSDTAVVLPDEQTKAINAALTRLANTNGTMIIETPARYPNSRTYELWQQAKTKSKGYQFHAMEIPYQRAVEANIISEQKIEEYRNLFGREFAMYMECKWLAVGGNAFEIKDIDRAEYLGRTVNYTEPMGDSTFVSMGLDPGFGSSAFGIVITQAYNGRIEVIYTERIPNSTPDKVMIKAYELKERYYVNKVYMDAANTELVRMMKALMNDNPDGFKEVLDMAARDGRNANEYMDVIPVSFGKYGKEMLAHLYSFLSHGILAIHPDFHELIAEMRSAVLINGDLDKKSQNKQTFDILDALRLCLLEYNPEFPREKEDEIIAR